MTPIRLVIATTLLATGSQAFGQGMAVFDASTYAQTLATVRNTLSLIEQGRAQLSEAQRLYASMNRLTDVNTYGAVLNLDAVRNLLPPEARDIERLIKGNSGSGDLSARAEHILRDTDLDTGSTRHDAVEAAYQSALEAAGRKSATTAAIADTAFDVSTRRTEGLEDLRHRLDGANDAKEVADLQARIAVETAHIQNDQNKLAAITLRRAAQQELDLRADGARAMRDLNATLAGRK